MSQYKKSVWAVTSKEVITHLVSFSKPVTAEEAMDQYYHGSFEEVIEEIDTDVIDVTDAT